MEMVMIHEWSHSESYILLGCFTHCMGLSRVAKSHNWAISRLFPVGNDLLTPYRSRFITFAVPHTCTNHCSGDSSFKCSFYREARTFLWLLSIIAKLWHRLLTASFGRSNIRSLERIRGDFLCSVSAVASVHGYSHVATRIVLRKDADMIWRYLWFQRICFPARKALPLPVPYWNITFSKPNYPPFFN